MSEQPRNWDKEMADIDRVIAKEGVSPPPGRAPALPPGSTPPPARVAAPAVSAKRPVAKAWFWVVLAVLLGAALPLWPYGKECGLQFFFYLGATTLAFLAGVAGAAASWGTRSGLGHMVSLVVVLWSAALGAREILPRVGYAAEAKTWLCPATPEPAPQTAPQAAPGTAPKTEPPATGTSGTTS